MDIHRASLLKRMLGLWTSSGVAVKYRGHLKVTEQRARNYRMRRAKGKFILGVWGVEHRLLRCFPNFFFAQALLFGFEK